MEYSVREYNAVPEAKVVLEAKVEYSVREYNTVPEAKVVLEARGFQRLKRL